MPSGDSSTQRINLIRQAAIRAGNPACPAQPSPARDSLGFAASGSRPRPSLAVVPQESSPPLRVKETAPHPSRAIPDSRSRLHRALPNTNFVKF